MVMLFDTSVLVAAHAQAHPQFTWADAQVQAATHPTICSHSLAEMYSVMTAHPQLRYPPAQVQAVLESLTRNWTVIALEPGDYLAAISRCQELNLPGGAIYDTLLAQAAVKASATAIVTLNPKHFVRLGDDIASLIAQPK